MGTKVFIAGLALVASSATFASDRFTYSEIIRSDVLNGRDAGVQVIEQKGKTTAIDTILYPDGTEPAPKEELALPKQGVMSEIYFPVETPLMSPGIISENEGTNIPRGLYAQPVFLIGYDRGSLAWLESNLDILHANKAMGMVVNVDTPQQMKRILQIAQDKVIIQAVSGQQIAQSLNLYHYPAYIDADGLLRN